MTTRAEVETVLIRRVGTYLTKAGLDGTTIDGTNADLNDPIGWAIRQGGGSVASIIAVTSAEVAAAADVDKLLDFAEYRTLENIVGNLAVVDTKLGPRDEKLSQLNLQIEAKLRRLRESLEKTYRWSIYASGVAPTLPTDGYSNDVNTFENNGGGSEYWNERPTLRWS